MDYLPLFLNIRNQPCLVIGGGDIAARKAALLLEAGARVTVVAPDLHADLKTALDQGRIEYTEGSFEASQLNGRKLVIAATDDSEVNARVSAEAQRLNIPVNVVDSPRLCSFIMPSIIDRSPVQIAVSTGGVSPVLARLIRATIEAAIPASYGKLAKLAADFRDQVKQSFSTVNDRRVFWENTLAGPVAELALSGNLDQAREQMQGILDNKSQQSVPGEVYLVGAGPGDPDLLTFKALRLMQQADVIVYDRLVSKGIMDLCRRDAARIYVGKERDNHAVPQEGINQMLVRLAQEGKRVCRLKGGDPFIFGRGGEEIDTLADNKVNFQVVPGITAASGCASYAGIPLTHRDYAQTCLFATGNLKDGTVNLNWNALVQPNQTVVIYMGLVGVKIICEQMISHGRAADTPAALIQRGTTPDQKVCTGTLATLPTIVKKAQAKPPTLIIIGEVVTLQKKLAWYQADGDNSGCHLD
ncbi:MAG: uroporphyrinogen-III C-methyltransferase [Gammaproteobacteria bacterium]|nr:MAG: uroporphyrinogen-III C-methyltransferase [Gammaproteobacteria bacterium]